MILISLFVIPLFESNAALYLMDDVQPGDCRKDEYYDVLRFRCVKCDPFKMLSPAGNGLSCTCNKKSIIVGWGKNSVPACSKCADGQIPSRNSRFCISCGPEQKNELTNECPICSRNSVIVDQDLNGRPLNEQKCVLCEEGTLPSDDSTHCSPCHWSMPNCTCPVSTHEIIKDQLCVPKTLSSTWPRNVDNILVNYRRQSFVSKFFRNNLYPSIFLCQMSDYGNCEALANMCVLNMYQHSNSGGPCHLFKGLKRALGMNYSRNWIYYGEGEAQNILNRNSLNTSFSLNPSLEDSFLHFKLSKWQLNGSWLGFNNGLSALQLCPYKTQIDQIRFAAYYEIACYLTPKNILKLADRTFYDVYLQYKSNNRSHLLPVPILNRNYRHKNKYINKGSDVSQWVLTRRLFLVENILGFKTEDYSSIYPRVIRYLKSIQLRVKVHSGTDEGNIYSPLLILSYGELTKADFERNIPVKISFTIDFHMNSSIKWTIDVVLGILCAISVVWSLIRCWCHTYRSGQRTIDMITLVNLLIISCGHLANVFFFVIACSAVHSFIYYKGQSVTHVLLPSTELIYLVQTYIITAFPLKVCEVLAMVWHQITVDVFLVDWEQPRVRSQTKLSVSAWRTYFVANEWNEIQTIRKTSLVFQLAVTVTILKVLGLENWANSTPELQTTENNNYYNVVFHFAVGVIVYSLVYVAQLFFMVGFYRRYIKNPIQEFVDVCSLANISVFVLSHPNFGYYIHGRSAHGFADTDMGTLRSQLHREAEDLVVHRGLVPDSDHQTFQLLIPPRLRCIYTSLSRLPDEIPRPIWRKPTKGKSGVAMDRPMESYINMNRFLMAFIDHAVKDLDYEVKDKTFFESLFDVECYNFKNSSALFYDNGHSFDTILYHGNELTLFTFDIILFCFIEVMTHNFILAGVVTGFCSEFISILRRFAGRKNLAKKTFIDEHFLI